MTTKAQMLEREAEVLELAYGMESFTIRQLMKQTDVPQNQVRDILELRVETGLLKKNNTVRPVKYWWPPDE